MALAGAPPAGFCCDGCFWFDMACSERTEKVAGSRFLREFPRCAPLGRYSPRVESEPAANDELEESRDAGAVILRALRESIEGAERALGSVETPADRRESVRTSRRNLKAVRALVPLLRPSAAPEPGCALDAVLEYGAKANQLLGPLRDRDALTRSIQRIADRFVDAETRRVVRTVLYATLVFAETDRRDESEFALAAIERARRSIRRARGALDHALRDALPVGVPASAVLADTFAECRDTLGRALEQNDLATMHACRKHATFLALALEPFGRSLEPALRRLRRRAKGLAAALGEERDLALLDVEMRIARARLEGSPLVRAIDDSIRLARLEAFARVEDAALEFLKPGPRRMRRELRALFEQ